MPVNEWRHHLELGDLFDRLRDPAQDYGPIRDEVVARLRAAPFYSTDDIVLRYLVDDLAAAQTIGRFDREMHYLYLWADQPHTRVWLCNARTKGCPPLPATCRCVVSCADDPATRCGLSGQPHVHPDDGTDTFGRCPVHPDAPGDL